MKTQEFVEKMKLVKVYGKMDSKKHAQLIKKSWELYLKSFPDGYATFVRDFDKKKFAEVLSSSDYIKFILTDNADEVISFALISNKKRCLIEASSVDPDMLKRKLPSATERMFWIFVFMTDRKSKNHSFSSVTLCGKVFGYILKRNGIIGFSRDLEEVPTLIKQIKHACKMLIGIELEDKDVAHEVTTLMYPKPTRG